MTVGKGKGKWEPATALMRLDRMGVRPSRMTFTLIRGQDLGCGGWGAMDFLTHYCGYRIEWTRGQK